MGAVIIPILQVTLRLRVSFVTLYGHMASQWFFSHQSGVPIFWLSLQAPGETEVEQSFGTYFGQ